MAATIDEGFSCIVREADGQCDMKAWDNGVLIYDFCLEDKKQWIMAGYEEWFEYFDDPKFTDAGFDWYEELEHIEKLFKEIYGTGEPDYFDWSLRYWFSEAIAELDNDPWRWRRAFNSMGWYKVFENQKVVKGFPKVGGISDYPESSDSKWQSSQWYP